VLSGESVFEIVVGARTLWHGGPLQELRRVLAWLARFTWLSWRTVAPVSRVAPNLALQFDNVDELIGLPAQFVGHHRRLG